MSSIMRARSGLMGRGEPSEVMGLSQAEGCWTFDARDRMPRPSRATAHYLSEIAPTATPAPLPRAGSFIGATPSLPRVPAKVSSPASQRPFALGRRTADLLEPATGDGVPVGGPAGRGVIASNIDKQLAEIIRLDFLNNPPPAPTGAL